MSDAAAPRQTAARTLALAAALIALGTLLAAPTPAVGGDFQDGFETGDTTAWSDTQPPFRVDCDCYFSSDCPGSLRCDWGPGGPAQVDICTWRNPKPNGVPGAGCSVDHTGPWGGSICDGSCVPSTFGSPLGWEDQAAVREGVRRWGEAMLAAAAGGVPIDPATAGAVAALGLSGPDAALLLGREVAAVLVLAADARFYDAFCHWENGDYDPAWSVDLSADPCRQAAGRIAIEALAAELATPGGAVALEQIPIFCPGWPAMFTPACPAGPEALDCARGRIEAAAVFLSTPRAPAPRPGGRIAG